MKRSKLIYMFLIAVLLIASIGSADAHRAASPQPSGIQSTPVGSAFTYQGQLKIGGSPVNDTCNFQFSLWDSLGSGSPASGGVQIGATNAANSVIVSNGLFSVVLNFGDKAFTGAARWLQIAVKCSGDTGFVTSNTRQALAPTPYALGLSLPFTASFDSAFITPISVSNNASCTQAQGITFCPVAIQSNSDFGTAIVASSSSGTGVSAVSDSGTAISGTSNHEGVFGDGTNGVHGRSSSATDSGVWGENTDGGYGVSGSTNSTASSDAAGVWGDNAGSGVGVKGTSTSGVGVGVLGTVSGRSTYQPVGSFSNKGVWGDSATGWGVFGSTDSGIGVSASSGSGTALFAQSKTGALVVGCGPNPPLFGCANKFRVDGTGKVFANGGYQTGGADVAEFIPVNGAPQSGDVVEIDPQHPGRFRLAATPNSTAVAGALSTDPGVTMNAQNPAGSLANSGPQLALAGRVTVKVSAENGSIHPGDLLVASSTPGHAMRAPRNPAPGAVIGKALGSLNDGAGTIEMLVMLR
jgi:hypothetical protein